MSWAKKHCPLYILLKVNWELSWRTAVPKRSGLCHLIVQTFIKVFYSLFMLPSWPGLPGTAFLVTWRKLNEIKVFTSIHCEQSGGCHMARIQSSSEFAIVSRLPAQMLFPLLRGIFKSETQRKRRRRVEQLETSDQFAGLSQECKSVVSDIW